MTKLITMAALTKELALSRPTIYRLIDEGMPIVRIGRSIRFQLDEVMKWILEHQE